MVNLNKGNASRRKLLKPVVRRVRQQLSVRVLLVFAVLAAGSGLAQAATLASNVGVWTTVYHSEFSYHAIDVSVGSIAGAQKFSTGSNTAGYTLTSVEVYVFGVENAAIVKMRICEADSVGDPDTDNCLYTLTNPISYSEAGWNNGTYSDAYLNTFTAPANSTLSASTDYFIVFENDGTQATLPDTYSDYWFGYVFGGTEDSGGANGWSIGDNYYFKSSATPNTWGHSTGGAAQPYRIRINGSGDTDTTAPSLDSATVTGRSLVLTYNEALDEDSVPTTSTYSVSVSGGPGEAPSSVYVTSNKVNLTLGTAVTSEQTVTVSYTVPMSDPVQDVSGNDAPSLTDEPVDNQSGTTYRPRPPTDLTATADGPYQIDLSWTAPVDDGGSIITGYRIQFSPDGRQTGLNVIWNDVVANTNNSDTFYTETGLSPGTTRYYRVRAINSEGESEATSTATETTPTGDGTPSAPLHLRARDNGKTQIDLLLDRSRLQW